MLVDLEMRGHVAVVTLADDARRNALSHRLIGAFHAAMNAASDQGARATVLASSARVFCAGGDLAALIDAGGLTAPATLPFDYSSFAAPLDLQERLLRHPFPVVAAVDGAALGGGFELTLCCDAVVAGPGAMFGLPETGIGLVPSVALARLPGLIGRRRTFELALSQRRLNAEEARALGLVDRIADSGTVTDTAVALATSLVAKTSPAAVAAVKAILAREPPLAWNDVAGTMEALSMREWQEGLSAFVSRRTPSYDAHWETASRAVTRR